MERFFRADILGSMLRPSYLKIARSQLDAGALTAVAFKRVEDRAVDQAVALQEAVGLEVVSDGEMRRSHFIAPLSDVIEGARVIPAFKRTWRRRESAQVSEQTVDLQVQLAVVEKIRRRRSVVAEEFSYLRARARSTPKVALPSPLMMALRWSPQYSRQAYADPFDLFRDAAEIVREDARELAALGCEYIQIDAPELGMLCDPQRRQSDFGQLGIDPERMLSEGMEIINSVATVPGVTFGLHLCRGNNAGYYVGEGGYEAISQQAFRRATNYANFLLEYDDWRSGSFEPLRDLPRDKHVVLGLISTKREQLETPEAIERRVAEAAAYFPREQMGLSTQCGFGSTWEGNPVSVETQTAKLALVVEMARRLWP